MLGIHFSESRVIIWLIPASFASCAISVMDAISASRGAFKPFPVVASEAAPAFHP
jgi:hypothetical protein